VGEVKVDPSSEVGQGSDVKVNSSSEAGQLQTVTDVSEVLCVDVATNPAEVTSGGMDVVTRGGVDVAMSADPVDDPSRVDIHHMTVGCEPWKEDRLSSSDHPSTAPTAVQEIQGGWFSVLSYNIKY